MAEAGSGALVTIEARIGQAFPVPHQGFFMRSDYSKVEELLRARSRIPDKYLISR